MIEMTKWFKMEQVVKGTWFAAILTSGFTNSNDGHIGYKNWLAACFIAKSQRSIICGLLKVSRKGFEVFCCWFWCLHSVHAAWNKFTIVSFPKVSVKPRTGQEHPRTLPEHPGILWNTPWRAAPSLPWNSKTKNIFRFNQKQNIMIRIIEYKTRIKISEFYKWYSDPCTQYTSNWPNSVEDI